MSQSDFPIKSLVLAAGLGTRLLPLTKHLPKPLLPVFGPSLFHLALEGMYQHGLKEVAANSHHLSEKIQAELIAGYKDLKLHSSYEPQILGTGGAIPPLRPWLGKAHLLIFNSDILCDVNLTALVKHHFASEALATMVCLKNGAMEKTPIYHDGLHVRGIGKISPKYAGSKLETTSFSGIHILSPTFMDQIPSGKPHHIIDTYVDLLDKGLPISIFFHGGLWSDLGTPQDYFGTLKNIQKDFERLPLFKRTYQAALDSAKFSALKNKPFYSTLHQTSSLGPDTFWFNDEEPPPHLTTCDHTVILNQANLTSLTKLSHKIIGYGEVISLDQA